MLEMDAVCKVTGLVPLFKLIDILCMCLQKEYFLAVGGGSTFWAEQLGAFFPHPTNSFV